MARAIPKLVSTAGSVSLLLRLMSLVGKLALTLYMGKVFPLAELGLYGLAFGAVMVANVAFGFRIDYVVARDIFGLSRDAQRRRGTEVALLYLLSFIAAAPFAMAAAIVFAAISDMSLFVLLYLVCGVEAYANYLYTVTIALKRPALANALFFLRSGAWTVPAIGLSYFEPEWRTVEFVLGWWLAGASASASLNLWAMRSQMLARVKLREIGWRQLRAACGKAFPVWVGSIAVTLGVYVDRFVLASYLSLDEVGIATFYTSFTIAALTLVQSATTSVTFPRMIQYFDAGELGDFRRELRRTATAAAALALLTLGGLAIAMPVLAGVLGKPQISEAYPAFLVLLVATMARTHGETLYYGLFVERNHRAIWLGNLLFLACSIALNFLLVPIAGLLGFACAALISAIFIAGWRWRSLQPGQFRTRPQHRSSPDVDWRRASEGEALE